MALWLFPSPQIVRLQRALEEQPVFSLWTRVKRDVPSTVLRLNDGVTWNEYAGAWPQTVDPRVQFLFGSKGFNAMGSDQSAFAACTRLYIGGHQYVIDDTLKNELTAAVTSFAATGYGAFILAAPPGSVYTGDEIILSNSNVSS